MDFLLSKIINRPKNNINNHNSVVVLKNNNDDDKIKNINNKNDDDKTLNDYSNNQKNNNDDDVGGSGGGGGSDEKNSTIITKNLSQTQTTTTTTVFGHEDDNTINNQLKSDNELEQENKIVELLNESSEVQNCQSPILPDILNGNVQLKLGVDDLKPLLLDKNLHLDVFNNHSSDDEESFAECNSYIDTEVDNASYKLNQIQNKEVHSENTEDKLKLTTEIISDDLSYISIKLPDFANENLSDIELDFVETDTLKATNEILSVNDSEEVNLLNLTQILPEVQSENLLNQTVEISQENLSEISENLINNSSEDKNNSLLDHIRDIESSVIENKEILCGIGNKNVLNTTIEINENLLNKTVESVSLVQEPKNEISVNIQENSFNTTQNNLESPNANILNLNTENISIKDNETNVPEILQEVPLNVNEIKEIESDNLLNNTVDLTSLNEVNRSLQEESLSEFSQNSLNVTQKLSETYCENILNITVDCAHVVEDLHMKENVDSLLNKTVKVPDLIESVPFENFNITELNHTISINDNNLTEVVSSEILKQFPLSNKSLTELNETISSNDNNLTEVDQSGQIEVPFESKTTIELNQAISSNNLSEVVQSSEIEIPNSVESKESSFIKENTIESKDVQSIDAIKTGQDLNSISPEIALNIPNSENQIIHSVESNTSCESLQSASIETIKFINSTENLDISTNQNTEFLENQIQNQLEDSNFVKNIFSSDSFVTENVPNKSTTSTDMPEEMDGIEYTGELKDIRIRSDIYNGNNSSCFSPNSIINNNSQQNNQHIKLPQRDSGIFVENIIQDNFNVTFKKPAIPNNMKFEKLINHDTTNHNEMGEKVAEEEFSSSPGLIFESADFDYLSARGNNNIEIERNSILLRFDPLLGHAVPIIIGQQQQLIQQQQNLSTDVNRLSPTHEEIEFDENLINYSQTEPQQQQLEENLTLTDLNLTDDNIRTSLNTTVLIKDLSYGENHQEVKQVLLENTFENNKGDATMSLDVLKDMKIVNDIKSLDLIHAQTDVKKEFKMAELEKKMKNEVLKTEDIEKKLKDAETREETLVKRITEKDKTITKMNSVMEAYEKAIAELIAEKEQIIQNYDKKCSDLKTESDLNGQHLLSLEATFSDLHVKYERSKHITTTLKQNEDILIADRKQNAECLKAQEQRYEKMKCHAMAQLEIANDKLENLTKSHSHEITKLKAILKKEELSRSSVSEQLSQKTRENEELVKICDELINGGSS